MHAAVEADTEDGNAALAGRAAGRQGGRRATIPTNMEPTPDFIDTRGFAFLPSISNLVLVRVAGLDS
jgi:hypothetical protein